MITKKPFLQMGIVREARDTLSTMYHSFSFLFICLPKGLSELPCSNDAMLRLKIWVGSMETDCLMSSLSKALLIC